jgi:hypothetical protein
MSLTINQTVTFPDTKGTMLEGIVHKLNPKKAHVKITKGNHRFTVGMVICVPYRLLGVGDYGQGIATPYVPAQATPSVPFTPSAFWVTEHAMELMMLDNIFGQLSPENLCGDGEIPRWRVEEKRKQLHRELNAIYVLLGREIDETQHYEIMDKFRAEIIQSIQQSLKWQERRIAIPSMT